MSTESVQAEKSAMAVFTTPNYVLAIFVGCQLLRSVKSFFRFTSDTHYKDRGVTGEERSSKNEDQRMVQCLDRKGSRTILCQGHRRIKGGTTPRSVGIMHIDWEDGLHFPLSLYLVNALSIHPVFLRTVCRQKRCNFSSFGLLRHVETRHTIRLVQEAGSSTCPLTMTFK